MQLILQTNLPDEAGSCKAGVRLQVFTLVMNEKKKQSKKEYTMYMYVTQEDLCMREINSSIEEMKE